MISLRIDWYLNILKFEYYHFKDLVWKKYFDFEYINELDGWLMTSAVGFEPPNVCNGSCSVRIPSRSNCTSRSSSNLTRSNTHTLSSI